MNKSLKSFSRLHPNLHAWLCLSALMLGTGLGNAQTVLGWGDNSRSQLNIPASATNAVAVAAGWAHSLALRTDGTVVGWGTDPNGAARVPASATNVVIIAAGTNYCLAVTADGQLLSWGTSTLTNLPSDLGVITAIGAGVGHCLAIRNDTTPPRIVEGQSVAYQSRVGANTLLPLYARAIGAGPLHYQWLADGVPIPDSDTPLPRVPAIFGTDQGAYQAVISNPYGSITSSVAQVEVLRVNAWGDNRNGQLTIPAGLANPVAIRAGTFHCLALEQNGSVTAWGKNRDQQALPPSVANSVAAIAGGGDHTLALNTDGTIIAWGRNWDGQTDVPPNATNVAAVAAGFAHSLALLL